MDSCENMFYSFSYIAQKKEQMNPIHKKQYKTKARSPPWRLVVTLGVGPFLQLSNTRLRTPRTAAPAWRLSWRRLYSPPSRWRAVTAAGEGSAGGLSAPPTGLEEGEESQDSTPTLDTRAAGSGDFKL